MRTKEEKQQLLKRQERLKRRRTIGNLSELEKLEIINLYLLGTSELEISKKYQLEISSVSTIVKDHRSLLENTIEAKALKISQNSDVSRDKRDKGDTLVYREGHLSNYKNLLPAKSDNSKFLTLLSEPNSKVLTDEESKFCWLYVYGESQEEALRSSGLDIGILNPSNPKRSSTAIKLRCLYLKQKPNIAEYIKELQEKNLVETKVDKEFVQIELLQQIAELKGVRSLQGKNTLHRYLETLGKTIGAFTENVNVGHVDVGKSLDDLLSSAKKARVTEVSDNTELIED